MPSPPASPRAWKIIPASRVVKIALLCFSGTLLLSPDIHARWKETWQPFPQEELTGTTAPMEPDAAAEVLFRKIEIDDTDFPRSRTTTEYARYKIFDPERADNIVRLSEFAATANGDNVRKVDMSARLTLADGTTKEFGAESIHEQNVIRRSFSSPFLSGFSNQIEVKQKFLAVGGAQPGSILEFKVRTVDLHPPGTAFRPLQIADVPIRRLEYIHRLGQDQNFRTSFFVLNGANIETKADKKNFTITLSGHDLPSLRSEPYSGVPTYYSATAVTCYDFTHLRSLKQGFTASQRFSSKSDPWAPCATMWNWISQNHIEDTKAVKEAAAEITQGATSDLEKAQRIHDYVQNLNQRFVHQPKKSHEFFNPDDLSISMASVLNFEKEDVPLLGPGDFLWLAISLYRAAGLHAETLLLPDRVVARFDLRLTSMAFLPGICAAVEVDGQWHFSAPHLSTPIPFDELPWPFEGQQGLLALENKQEFIDVPLTAPGQSVAKNEGTFELNAEGTLTGQCKRTLTGHYAYDTRSLLHRKKDEEQQTIIKRILGEELAPAEIEITDIENLDDPGKPVEISYKLTWTGFAVVADNRMFIHPFVFRTHSPSLFIATERHNPVYFPFACQTNDHLTIAFPPDYDLEVKAAPQSHPGEMLSHTLKLAYNTKHHVLYVDRDFSSSLIAVDPADYAHLKRWYDAVATSDQHELILIKKAAPVAANPATP